MGSMRHKLHEERNISKETRMVESIPGEENREDQALLAP